MAEEENQQESGGWMGERFFEQTNGFITVHYPFRRFDKTILKSIEAGFT